MCGVCGIDRKGESENVDRSTTYEFSGQSSSDLFHTTINRHPCLYTFKFLFEICILDLYIILMDVYFW